MLPITLRCNTATKLSLRRRELKIFLKNLKPVFGDKNHIETQRLLGKIKKNISKEDEIKIIENILRINNV